MSEPAEALVIGAGPAGLMAAETLAAAGRRVVIAERMPTPGRKLLMAGKSGLNLTMSEDADLFARHVQWGGNAPGPGSAQWGPREVMAWAEGLGVPLFTGSSGRVFPVGMKAAPLLRAWLARLAAQGAALRTRWNWQGFADGASAFATPDGPRVLAPRVTVLALGGASWPRLGSDGVWAGTLRAAGVAVAPFRPANMGLRVDWSPAMARHFGAPVKGTAIRAGDLASRGEWVLTRGGIEGGGVYAVVAAIRDGAAATVDLVPDLSDASLAARFAAPRGRLSLGNWLRRVLRDPVKVALLLEWGGRPAAPSGWAATARALPLRHAGPMGLERAISTAGGIPAAALEGTLALTALTGVFAAGEMLDWEAPTGGYLMTTCLDQGRRAGLAAATWLDAAGA